MKNYRFEYIEGGSKPFHTVEAEYDQDAFKLIAKFLKAKSGRSLVPNSIRMTENRKVEDPPDIMAFLQHVTIEEFRGVMSRAAKSKFKIPGALKNR